MIKNTSGQTVSFQAVSVTDGSAVTAGTPTVYVTINGGTQSSGGGTSTHEGNGCWSYAPTQAETNGNQVAFTFVLSGAVNQTANVFTVNSDVAAVFRIEMDANSNQLASIVADTNELQTDDVPGLIAALNDLSSAEVNVEVDTALADIHLDHLMAVADADTPVDGSIFAMLASSTGDWSTFLQATDSLQAIRDEGNASWNTTAPNPMLILASEIDTVTSQTTFTMVDGASNDDTYINQTMVLYDTSGSVDDKSICVVTGYDGTTKTITLASGPDFTLADDDRIEMFATAKGSTAPTTAQIVTAIDGTSSQMAAIVADTNEMQQALVYGGRIDLMIDAIKSKTDSITLTGNQVQVILHDATPAGLAKFSTVDTGETTPADGSIAKLSQGAGSGGSGEGAYQIPVTVKRSSDNLPVIGAVVSIAGTTVSGTTGVAGTVILNADDGTYAIRVTPPSGYSGVADVSKTVSGADVAAFDILLTESTAPDDQGLFSRVATATDWEIPFVMGDLSGTDWEELRFTAKTSPTEQDDTAAALQVKVSRVSDVSDGLLIANGAAASEKTYGEIEITNTSTGTGVVRIFAAATDLISPTQQRLWSADDRRLAAMLNWRIGDSDDAPLIHWDVKRLDGSGRASPVREVGYLVVTEAVTQEVV